MRINFNEKAPSFILLMIASVILLLVLFNVYLSQKVKIASFFEPKPGSCLILEEKYCRGVILVDDPTEKDGLLAVYKLPVGTTLFSPTEGYYSNTPTFFFENTGKEVDKYPGVNVIVSKDNTVKNTSEIYSFVFYNKSEQKNTKISKGEKIGTVSNENVNYFGNYNLVVRLTKQDYLEGKPVFLNDYQKLKNILKIK